ncbi:MobF family relaxase [Herbaspirillum sp. RV1423]|uniref:MobF family relaxase n=1 Tax=Herbaspirillum sp. RV1423 TaxID=1443993 RepID=UPI0004AD4BDA|nr:MobF family relaxase [Herbaspirillum sp. RV1423]
MISSATISSSGDAAKYHDAALAKDGNTPAREADNYYANDQAVATWQGAGAELLGIKGEKVTKEAFVEHLEGRLLNPDNGQTQDLSKNSKGGDRRLGYDFTVSAPKSVSVMGLVGGDRRVVDAHIEANARALAWIERHASQVRIKDSDGNNVIKHTNNLLYATVQHETSRQNDPQLHNHNVIVSATYDTEAKKWRSLTNDELFKIRASADTIYKNELSMLLHEAGYQIVRNENGVDFEIAGISGEQLSEFSQRTKQMNEAIAAHGGNPEHASYFERQTAVLDSRAAKSDIGKDILWQQWRDRAADMGLGVDRIVNSAIDRAKSRDEQGYDPSRARSAAANAALNRAIEHLSEREQTFKLSELEKQAVFFTIGDASITDIQAAISERFKDRSLVERENRPGEDARLVTTAAAVSHELTLKDAIEQGHNKGVKVLIEQQDFDRALQKFEERKSAETNTTWRLSYEQRIAAQNLLMHADKYQGVQGDAGTGKTAALEFVHEVAAEKGWEIVGIATTTTAARNLEKDTGIPSQTVAAFMLHNDQQAEMLKSDLDKLAIQIAHEKDNSPAIKLVQRLDLNLKGDLGGFGTARYVFDEKTGQVHKSPASPHNVLNRLGHHLTDSSIERHEAAKVAWRSAERFQDRFKAGAIQVRANLETRLGASLASYSIVGSDEKNKVIDERDKKGLRNFNELQQQFAAKQAQLSNLQTTGHVEGRQYLLVMDESSLTGTKDTARLTELARDIGARVVLQGDIKQHGSVAAGRAFAQAQQAGINLSKIEETRRFDNAAPEQKLAIHAMKKGWYAEAIDVLPISEVEEKDLAVTAAERYLANTEELEKRGVESPKVGIVAITNADRKEINSAVRDGLKEAGRISSVEYTKQHLDDPKLTAAQKKYAASLRQNKVNRVIAMKPYRSLGVQSEDVLKILSMDAKNNKITIEREDGKQFTISPEKFKKLDYARLEQRSYSVGDRVEARANHGKEKDPNRVVNGERGTIIAIDNEKTTIKWDGEKPRELPFSNKQMATVDLAYARTTYKEQGVTNHREIIAVSEIGAHWFNREAAYVAASRAKDNTEIVTSDRKEMLKNAGKETTKTTAIDIKREEESKKTNQEQSVARQIQIVPDREKDISQEQSLSM